MSDKEAFYWMLTEFEKLVAKRCKQPVSQSSQARARALLCLIGQQAILLDQDDRSAVGVRLTDLVRSLQKIGDSFAARQIVDIILRL